ncbi:MULTISPECIES: crossover junction endodeoxyribonuclease RuvC [unclassified Pseudodesulfovibrio]|uniref:crossover junction endodeoxyribonuclease RuvC n=1 Tax=unclassified Pseudodesulfovibrio TaxID=2661612 RepID=UPI000FEC1613|nr:MULTISPECIES: crossover junction endodeoxyribonuclease RuvC [unclassified Pseudodesulfovibrio]MCJ2165045.1 crossover junction endodeoxyribonuclease RuvC [Pseudodesulfovibrio sp. S3-i]RWU03514.1 crossover junction endodeoxyribonuclease RuvC [Pseudodesulfovibrio sp. S3]
MAEGLVVLGLDPGTRVTGYGFVREISGQAELVATGTIRTPVKKDMATRMGVIFEQLQVLIRQHCPVEAAIENVFVSKNPSSALKLGQARGVCMAACAVNGISMGEYEPTKVKKNLVGVGSAPKSQVAFMVANCLGLKKPDWPEDASDALAVAICHLNERRMRKLTGM